MNVHWDRVMVIHPFHCAAAKDQARTRQYKTESFPVLVTIPVNNLSNRLQCHFLSLLVNVTSKQHTSGSLFSFLLPHLHTLIT